MRPLHEIRGLRFPDEYVVRHFFKRGLDCRTGRALELGCGTGNNLSLYSDFGWNCVGIDFDAAALADARHNLGESVELVSADLGAGLPPLDGQFDVLVVAGLLCYLTLSRAEKLLSDLKPSLAPGCELFVRTRMVDDYRYGRGQEEEPDGYRLTTPETRESGLFNHFYTQAGLMALLCKTLGLRDAVELAVRFDNIQAGKRVPGNSDLVIWGRTQ